ncbi:hypothetical protein Hanom_Chr13g01213061 [Helianthus anomalus]
MYCFENNFLYLASSRGGYPIVLKSDLLVPGYTGTPAVGATPCSILWLSSRGGYPVFNHLALRPWGLPHVLTRPVTVSTADCSHVYVP